MRRLGPIVFLAFALALDASGAGATGIKAPHPPVSAPPVASPPHRPPPLPPTNTPIVVPPIVVPPVVIPPVVVPPVVVPPVVIPPLPGVGIEVRVPAEVMPPIPRAPKPPVPVGVPGRDTAGVLPDAADPGTEPAAATALIRPGAPSSTLAGVAARDFAANRVLVAIPLDRAGDPGRGNTNVADDYGLDVEGEADLLSLGVRLVTFTVVRPRGLGDLLDQMGLDARFQSAQPVFRYRVNAGLTALLPGPSYPAQNMRLPSARLLASGAGVIVSLVDTHVAELPSLRGHVVERVALVPGGDGLHGTALAGLIASVAPDARLIAIEAFDERANGPNGDAEATTMTLARAIDVALNRKSDVINLSIAGPRDPLIGRMVRQALSQGTILVAAAGNDGPTAPPRYPAAYDGVIAVTASDSRNQLYPLAARGPHVAIAAPGVDVPVELPDAMVGYFSGTSVAAAEVAGVAALLRERAPRLASADARRLLKATATPMPEGPGLVDAFAALSRASPFAQR